MAVAVVMAFVAARTKFGRYVYAIGGNPEAARRAGVSLPAVRTWGFVLSALTAGIAGVLFVSWQVSLTTNIIKTANTYVLLAVAAGGAMVLRWRLPAAATATAGIATVAGTVLGACQDPMLATAWCVYALAVERAASSSTRSATRPSRPSSRVVSLTMLAALHL